MTSAFSVVLFLSKSHLMPSRSKARGQVLCHSFAPADPTRGVRPPDDRPDITSDQRRSCRLIERRVEQREPRTDKRICISQQQKEPRQLASGPVNTKTQ
ncbi:hypothetical protein MHYP_G00256580 [Metynnis hypsauchen]